MSVWCKSVIIWNDGTDMKWEKKTMLTIDTVSE